MNKEKRLLRQIARFWDRVAVSGPDDCWEWQGYRQESGHGKSRFEDRVEYTHRIAFFLAHGVMPPVVRHNCDNPPCCNARHLRRGIQEENVQDRQKRGRSAWQKDRPAFRERIKAGKSASSHHQQARKLTFEIAEEIRRLRAEGESVTAIAERFNISQQKVSQIVHRRIYREP